MLIFTKANADANGRVVNALIENFAAQNPDYRRVFDSLGVRRYFSLLKQVDVVVGNSSSGIIEAPSLGVPTINVGNRQNGRIRANSVVDYGETDLGVVLQQMLNSDFKAACKTTVNPYGDGQTALRILKVLETFTIKAPIKAFNDLRNSNAKY
jgi:UDP-N-acetylglucosamine 2-epimerase